MTEFLKKFTSQADYINFKFQTVEEYILSLKESKEKINKKKLMTVYSDIEQIHEEFLDYHKRLLKNMFGVNYESQRQ